MRLDRLVKLEKRLASWFDRSLRDPGGSPDPIELVPMILDHVEEHVQPTADGGRAFPYDRVTIQVRTRDGKLSQDELFARTPATGNSVLPNDRQAGRQSAYFQRLDADKDGSVTLVEFMTQADRNFARCDVDKNGRIDTAECRQALQRKSAER